MKTNDDMEMWNDLAEHLTRRSAEICEDNGCTEDEHNCESYAYISQDGDLHDICASDYWQGWGSADEKAHGGIASIPLPWAGSGENLREAVDDDSWCDDDDRGRTQYRNGDEIGLTAIGCDGCSPSMVNGVLCHEQGCPDAWRDCKIKCWECGCEEYPSERGSRLCAGCANPHQDLPENLRSW